MSMTDEQKKQRKFDEMEKAKFAVELLFDLKIANLNDNANLFNALWIHHRLANWEVTVPNNEQYGPLQGRVYNVNILNFVKTGDLDSVCYALMWGAADDMTEPDHWFSQERIDSIVNTLKSFLGWS